MKKIINIIACLFGMSSLVFAQQTTNMPSTNPAPSATHVPVLPSDYSGSIILNMVRTIELKHPAVTEADINSARSANKTLEQTVYSDGFMRPLQVVTKKNNTLNSKDLVYHYNYDPATWLLKRDLLPFAKQDAGAAAENQFTKSVQTDLQATYAQLGYTNEPFLYSETMFEYSLRALPLQTRPPGKSWVGRGVGVTNQTRALMATDNLQRFTVAYPQSSVPVLQTTSYALNEVTVSISIDEDLNESKTFTTADGDMVAMEKNGVRTYYVYDFYHRQRYVLTPKALEEFASLGWVMDLQVIDNLCFRYEYDQRGNQVLIKKPGIGATEFRYNQQDQVVLSQDAAQQAQGKWVFHKYDIRGRLIQQGLFTGANVGQPVVDPSPDGSSVTGASGGGTSLSLLDYLYHKKVYSAVDYEYAFPNTEFIIHYYFDDYTFKDRLVSLGSYALPQLAFIGAVGNATEGYDATVSYNTQGLLTGVHMAVSDNSRWLAKVNYYNSRGELIQTIADDLRKRFNITGMGYD